MLANVSMASTNVDAASANVDAAFTNVEAYEVVALTDCDLLCCNLAELEHSPQLALGFATAMAARYRQAESLLALLGLRRVEERVRGFLELLAKGLWRTL